jgi:uncharacterized protein YecE (DUF72 family)
MKQRAQATPAQIRVGIGGWNYAPWHDRFYPADLPKAQQLHYASRAVTAIEINSTFYGAQKPATYVKWAASTPEDFVFSVKAPRSATHRRDLGEAREAIARFLENGPASLGRKLGPIVWQFAPTKRFVADEFEGFLAAPPERLGTQRLRHALDVRHASFDDDRFLQMAHRYRAAAIHTDTDNVPRFADITADFVYARLRNAQSQLKSGYSPAALRRWADAARSWRRGETPRGMRPRLPPAAIQPRDTYVYFINGAKERAPAAAMWLLGLLAGPPAK